MKNVILRMPSPSSSPPAGSHYVTHLSPNSLKREFPGLADSRLHYLDNAATAQMPEVVLDALRRFAVEARANVHEGLHARARSGH